MCAWQYVLVSTNAMTAPCRMLSTVHCQLSANCLGIGWVPNQKTIPCRVQAPCTIKITIQSTTDQVICFPLLKARTL